MLQGEPGPARDVVCLNAGAALYAAGAAGSLKEGVHLAQQSIDSGRALAKLDALRLFARSQTGGIDLRLGGGQAAAGAE